MTDLQTDLLIRDHGSIHVIYDRTPVGQEWLYDNVQTGGLGTWAGGIVCEPRYVSDIIAGARKAGLTVEVA
jgi:hypothetical protein